MSASLDSSLFLDQTPPNKVFELVDIHPETPATEEHPTTTTVVPGKPKTETLSLAAQLSLYEAEILEGKTETLSGFVKLAAGVSAIDESHSYQAHKNGYNSIYSYFWGEHDYSRQHTDEALLFHILHGIIKPTGLDLKVVSHFRPFRPLLGKKVVQRRRNGEEIDTSRVVAMCVSLLKDPLTSWTEGAIKEQCKKLYPEFYSPSTPEPVVAQEPAGLVEPNTNSGPEPAGLVEPNTNSDPEPAGLVEVGLTDAQLETLNETIETIRAALTPDQLTLLVNLVQSAPEVVEDALQGGPEVHEKPGVESVAEEDSDGESDQGDDQEDSNQQKPPFEVESEAESKEGVEEPGEEHNIDVEPEENDMEGYSCIVEPGYKGPQASEPEDDDMKGYSCIKPEEPKPEPTPPPKEKLVKESEPEEELGEDFLDHDTREGILVDISDLAEEIGPKNGTDVEQNRAVVAKVAKKARVSVENSYNTLYSTPPKQSLSDQDLKKFLSALEKVATETWNKG
jgi:hypothetical protein